MKFKDTILIISLILSLIYFLCFELLRGVAA